MPDRVPPHRQVAGLCADFFARWNEEVAQGHRQVAPFQAKPIPSFKPVRIEKQEILQEQGDS